MSINGFAVWSRSALVLLPLLVAVAAGGTASADDPPSRVGRIALIDGTVSFRPSPTEDWGNAVMNYPVAQSTAIWVEEGARAEIEVGSARIRLAGGTELDVNQLDDQNIVVAVPQGRIDVTLNGARPDERYDVQTPRGDAVLADGRYRIIAGTHQDSTSVATFTGTAQYTVNAQQFLVAPGEAAIANPIDPPTVQLSSATQDDFDGWAAQRDGKIYARPAPATVAGVPGTQELAEYGTWRTTPDYGEVWTPADVGPDWTPYSQGRWEDVSPWGWTWIDAEPWGFTPFHYGRWAFVDGSWGWIPVAPGVELGAGYEPVYAPALVAFLGDADGLAVGFDGPVVGWVPLGPGEFWHPWYRASYHYWRRANLTNVSRTVIDTVTIDNYQTVAAGQTLANRRAARLVPRQVFAGGQPVQRAGLQLRPDALNQPLHQAAVVTLPMAEAGARAGGAAQATSVPAAPVPRMAHLAPAAAAAQPRNTERASPIYHPSSTATAPVQTPPHWTPPVPAAQAIPQARGAPERGVSQPAQQRAPAPPQSRPRAEAQKPQR